MKIKTRYRSYYPVANLVVACKKGGGIFSFLQLYDGWRDAV